jgi:hypothetical protein
MDRSSHLAKLEASWVELEVPEPVCQGGIRMKVRNLHEFSIPPSSIRRRKPYQNPGIAPEAILAQEKKDAARYH